MPKRDIFNEEALLDFRKASLVNSDVVGFNKDDLVTFRWEIPLGALEQCQTWARENRRSINNVAVEFKEYEEPYRHVKVSASQRTEDRKGYVFEHTFARGWIQSLVNEEVVDWTEARRLQGSQPVGSNSSAAPASDSEDIADTVSDNPERHLFLEFEGVDPAKSNEIAESIGAIATVDNVAADGVSIAGTFHVISVSDTRADDGSATLRVYLAHPQFTLEAYRDFETSTAADVFYLWGVPKSLAQTIMDAWKAVSDETERPGRSATASYRSDNLVDLVLTKRATTLENLTETIPVACDTTETHHFGWGYTKTELSEFIDAHDDVLGAGETRSMRVSNRSDGLYDVHIVETDVTYDVAKHQFVVALAIGDKIVKTETSGWNIPLADLNTMKTTLEAETKTAGTVNEFEVTRKDDCTFDYRHTAVVSEKSDGEFDFTSGDAESDLGVDKRIQILEAATKDEVDIAIALDKNAPGPRRDITPQIQRRPDGLYDVFITETEIEKTEGESDSGSGGIAVEAYSGDNVDAGDLTDIVTSAAREHVTLSISGNPDGTFNYRATKQTVVDTLEEADSGSAGIVTSIKSGRNVDAGTVAPLVSAARKRVTISLSPNDDGTINYTSVSEEVVETTGYSSTGGEGISVEAYSGDNVTDLGTIITSAARDRINLSVSGNDDGTFNYRGTKQTVQEARDGANSGGGGVAVEVKSGRNVDAGTVAALTSGPRKRVTISLSLNDDGTVNYTSVSETSKPTTGDSGSSGSGVSIRAVSGDNVDEIGSPVSTAPRKSASLSVSGNPDGTYNYRGTETTIQPAETTSTSGIEGVGVTAVSGDNVDDVGAPVTSGPRRRASLSVSGNPDGTFNYRGTETAVQKTEGDANTGSEGVGVRAVSGDNVDAVDPPIESGPRKRVSLSVSGNDDGTYNYRGTETTVQEGNNIIEGGTVGSPVSYEVGTNSSANPTGRAPGVGEKITFQGRHNDDGTMDYVIANQSTVEQGQQDVSAGTKTQAQKISNALGAEFVPGGAPSTGKSFEIRYEVNKDGTVNYNRIEITREGVQETVSLSNRIPKREAHGVSDSATVFKGLTALPAASGSEFYYYDSLTIESDGTFSGIVHNLEYGSTDPLTWSGLTVYYLDTWKYRIVGPSAFVPPQNPETVAPVEWRRMQRYEVSVSLTKSLSLAQAAQSGGNFSSTMSKVSLEGEEWWMATRVRLHNEWNWELVE